MGSMLEHRQRELLDECRVGRLATISPGGRPRLVPVCYALVGDRIAIAIDEKPKESTDLARLRDLRRDPRATLLVDRWSEDWNELWWVRVDATGTILDEGAGWPEALIGLRGRYPQYSGMDLESRPMIALTPVRVVDWRPAGG